MADPLYACLDGVVSPPAEAKIEVSDDGLLRGDGAFEMVRLYRGAPYAMAEHLDRLERSAEAIELACDRAAIERDAEALLDEAGALDAALRIVLTRGGHRILLVEPLPEHPETIAVACVRYQPSEILTGVKSISYAANMQATRLAAARGAREAILVRPDGIVLEAPTSAVFWVRDAELRTPAIPAGILASITRQVIVDGLAATEGEWSADDLTGAEEAFLASTTREVQSIDSVDGIGLPAAPGPVTTRAATLLRGAIQDALGNDG